MGKIYDNVGWGAYLWVIQNKITFQTSTSEWWIYTNNLPVAITNVMVGSLGDYGPMSNVVDIGPVLDPALEYPESGQSNDVTYQVDYTNVFYKLVIPDIWINPIEAYACVGDTNPIQFTVYGTNITNGVTWTINPSGVGAEIYPSNDWHYASVTPGSVATNYKIRATSVDNTNFYDEVNLTVCKIEVTNIKFNHNTNSSTNDAINVRQDYNTAYDISNGEWVKGGTNIPACYTTNKAVTIKVRLTTTPAVNMSADICAESTDSGGSLGNVSKTNVSFSGGVSSPEYVTFQISGTTPNCVKKTTTDVWEWKVENIHGSGSTTCVLNTSGVHTVYTILAEPVSPWVNTAGNSLNVWSRVLDRACVWATGENISSNIVEDIVTETYSMGVIYDGDIHYTYPGYYEFHLQTLLNHLDTAGQDSMDCRDFANWGQTLLASVGIQTQYRVIDRTTSPGYFTYNYILPAGWTNWTTNNWSFHQIGWWNSKVFDASLKLDNDADPTQGPGDDNHTEKLSVGDMTQTEYLDKLTETPDVTDIETGTCQLQ